MALPVDWFMTIFFLAALVLTSCFRRHLTAVDPESYRRIVIGLGLLNLTALIQLYSEIGLLTAVPFLSEPIFFQLFLWVLIITGLTFLLSGVAEWLPLARVARESSDQTITRLTLFRTLEQLGSIEPRPEPFFQAVLAHVAAAHQFRAGAMYAVTARGDRVQFVGSVKCENHDASLAGVTLNGAGEPGEGIVAVEGLGMLAGLPGELGRPTYVLPVHVQQKVRGCFLFWAEATPDHDTELELKLVGDIVARRILHRSRQVKLDYFESLEKLYLRLNQCLSEIEMPLEKLACLVRELRPLVPTDFAMLVVPTETENLVDRLSVGANGRGLLERGVTLGPSSTTLQHDLSRSPATAMAVEASMTASLSRELPGDLRSLAVVRAPHGYLVLGVARPHAYTPAIVRALDYIAPHVGLVTDAYRADRASRQAHAQLQTLARLTQLDAGEIAFATARLTRYVRETLECESIRLSVLDQSGVFLNSIGLAAETAAPTMAPDHGSMIVDLLPMHARAIETAATISWSTESHDSELIESEAMTLSAGRIEELQIIPITAPGRRQRVVGLLTAVRSNPSRRRVTDDAARFLLHSAAALLSGPLDRIQAALRTTPWSDAMSVRADAIVEHRSVIRSSLTGILGSVELVRADGAEDPDKVLKFLNIIDRSARKIDACLAHRAPEPVAEALASADIEESYATR